MTGYENLMAPNAAGKRILNALGTGHVIYTLTQEHEIILGMLTELSATREKLISLDEQEMYVEMGKTVLSLAQRMISAEPHHVREEQALFPVMREFGISGPPDVMEMEHGAIRDYKNKLLETAEKVEHTPFKSYQARMDFFAKSLNRMLKDHISKENNILFPMALNLVEDENVWGEMRKKCDEIGYCSFTPKSSLVDTE